MDAKELLEELKVKADELYKYLEAHSDEANSLPSWMFSCLSTEKKFLLQGCPNSQHELGLAVRLINKLSETSIAAFMLVTLEVAKMVHEKQQEIERELEQEEIPQWIQ